ncbi:hypothetical protein EWM64_g10495 [Hericium alpestre]|uniref:cAMP-independent regulatory protein pac2 n=1 Tax=Hericium alpestre TaxID=135208 RepID=A0A4Y9ZHM8_9AGAM|nr:hypothetical protein EWM64_g10495 [Hericium alpestre]
MQSPTCTNVRIRSTHDVHRIFYAVYLGILPMITRRLDVKEREALRSGSCYAWEDRGPHAITGLGIERFTEGRHWSPSRIRDEFLFYYEKWEPPKNRTSNPQTNAASDSDEHPPRDWDPLVKQTYSVWLLSDSGRRKWHLTAYFTQATVDRLGTVDDIPGVRDLVVPDGLFRSSRINKAKRNGNAPNSDPMPPIGNGSSAQTPANSSAPPSSSSSNQERTYSHFPPRPEAERERREPHATGRRPVPHRPFLLALHSSPVGLYTLATHR